MMNILKHALLTDANFVEIVETAVITFSTISSAVISECATRAMLQMLEKQTAKN